MPHGHDHLATHVGSRSVISRRQVLRGGLTAGAAVGTSMLFPGVGGLARALAAESAGPLEAGVGVADITPENGHTFFGYVRPDRSANGVAIRLFARTVLLRSGDQLLALVTVDLGASLDKAGVLAHVAHLGLAEDNVVLNATHTHAGPEEWTDWLEERIAESICRAHADLGPARAAWARGTLDGVNQSRSIEAHLANHGLDLPVGSATADRDPDGADHVRDRNIRMLRVDRPDGTPVTAWSIFAVHPTAFPNTNTLYSADLSGLAVRRFEASFRSGGPDAFGLTSARQAGVPVGILANGNQGDMISLYASFSPHACADLAALRLAKAMRSLWDEAGTRLSSDVVVDIRWTRIGYQGQVVDEAGHAVASQALWGLPFLGGAKNGPSPFYQGGASEGQRRPAPLADPVQGRKIIAGPAPWRNDPELQVARIGDQLLIAVPGEATTETGRRANAAALEAAPAGVLDSAVVGLCNDYVAYFTTPEEYDQQHYEGGHTVFGKYTSVLLVRAGAGLAGNLADGSAAPEPATGNPSPYPPPGGPGVGVGGGAASGTIAADPPCEVSRFDIVGVKWDGGPTGFDRPLDTPFILVERRVGVDTWRPVDSDLGIAMHWSEADGRHLAEWEVARDAVPGVHRFRVTAARYEVASAPFVIQPSTGLVVLGGEVVGGRLVIRAQQPTPEPEVHLRHREVSPNGGTATVTIAGTGHLARWDDVVGGWAVAVPGLAPGTSVTVAAGALVDGAGNSNGAGLTFAVGDVAPAVWPADMAMGGIDRDWHGHAPSEVTVEREAGCAIPDAVPSGGDSNGSDGDDGSDEQSLPATGAGAAVLGVATIGAALRLRTGEREVTD